MARMPRQGIRPWDLTPWKSISKNVTIRKSDKKINQTKKRKDNKMKYPYINLEKLSPTEKRLLSLLDEEKEVHFCFWKKDGSREVRRVARGTRNTEYIPREKWPENPTNDVGEKINYYDFDRNDWRRVSVVKLIEIKEG